MKPEDKLIINLGNFYIYTDVKGYYILRSKNRNNNLCLAKNLDDIIVYAYLLVRIRRIDFSDVLPLFAWLVTKLFFDKNPYHVLFMKNYQFLKYVKEEWFKYNFAKGKTKC